MSSPSYNSRQPLSSTPHKSRAVNSTGDNTKSATSGKSRALSPQGVENNNVHSVGEGSGKLPLPAVDSTRSGQTSLTDVDNARSAQLKPLSTPTSDAEKVNPVLERKELEKTTPRRTLRAALRNG